MRARNLLILSILCASAFLALGVTVQANKILPTRLRQNQPRRKEMTVWSKELWFLRPRLLSSFERTTTSIICLPMAPAPSLSRRSNPVPAFALTVVRRTTTARKWLNASM